MGHNRTRKVSIDRKADQNAHRAKRLALGIEPSLTRALAFCLHASDFCYIYTIQPVRSSTCHDPTDKITVASSLFCVIAWPHTSHPAILTCLAPSTGPSPAPVFRRLYCTDHTSSAVPGPC